MVSAYHAAQSKFDPRFPLQNQLVVFGQERLAADVGNLATPETAIRFANRVVELCTEFNYEPAWGGKFRRDMHPDLLRPDVGTLKLGHSSIPELGSFNPEKSEANVNNAEKGAKVLHPLGYPFGTYDFWENVFIESGTEVPFVERNLVHSPMFRRWRPTITLKAIKAASEPELTTLIDRMDTIAQQEDDQREKELQQMISGPLVNRWWHQRR